MGVSEVDCIIATEEKLKEVIFSEEMGEFKENVINHLGIKNSNINILLEKIKTDSDGYKKNYTLAATFHKENKIVFYTDAIERYMKNKFKVYENTRNKEFYKKVLFIFIKRTLAHELVHVQQIESYKLTDKIITENEDIQNNYSEYENLWYEKEANEKAKKIMLEEEDNFVKEIISHLDTKNQSPMQTSEFYMLVEKCIKKDS
ncbi:TPA: hypothetical protein KQG29_001491 [Clostridioides difficile]|nr:hypothetical protein [Clostridioides difficile]